MRTYLIAASLALTVFGVAAIGAICLAARYGICGGPPAGTVVDWAGLCILTGIVCGAAGLMVRPPRRPSRLRRSD